MFRYLDHGHTNKIGAGKLWPMGIGAITLRVRVW